MPEYQEDESFTAKLPFLMKFVVLSSACKLQVVNCFLIISLSGQVWEKKWTGSVAIKSNLSYWKYKFEANNLNEHELIPIKTNKLNGVKWVQGT